MNLDCKRRNPLHHFLCLNHFCFQISWIGVVALYRKNNNLEQFCRRSCVDCRKSWHNAPLLPPYLLQTSLWSQKSSSMMSLGIPSPFTRRGAVSTAKPFDGRWTQPRWLRTVFLCVWKTVGMPVACLKARGKRQRWGDGSDNVSQSFCVGVLLTECSPVVVPPGWECQWPHTVIVGWDNISPAQKSTN